MRIPQIVSQGAGAATIAPYPTASPAAFGAGTGQALTQAGGQLESAALRGLEIRRQAEAAKTKVKAETDAAELSARFEVDLATLDTDLRRTMLDPDTYLEAYRAGSVKLREETARGASPEASALFQRKATPFLAGKQVEAIHHADKLFVDGREGALVKTLDHRAQLGGLAPIAGADEFVRQYREGAAAIQAAIPVIGEKRAAERMVKFREEMFAARARKHADTDPADFIAESETGSFYDGMDPNRRESLVSGAYRKLEAQDKERDRQENQARVALERDVKEQSEEAERRVIQQYRDGSLTIEYLNDLAELRLITSEKYDQYTKMLDKRMVEGPPASPELLRDLRIQVYSSDTLRDPKRVEARIVSMIAEGKLPVNAETDRWLSHLQSLASQNATLGRQEARQAQAEARTEARTAQADARRDQNEKRSLAQRDHAQVEQMLSAAMRTTSPFEKLSQEGQQAYALALEELSRRSAGAAGREDPYAVWADMKPRYIARLSDAVVNRVQSLRAGLGKYRNAAEVVADRPKLTQENYYRLLESLREIEGLERERGIMDVERKAK